MPIDPVLENFADAVAPAGSVWSSVLDMAEYLKCEMRDGSNDGGEQIISTENLLARRHPAIKIDGKSSYGLGWFLRDRQGLVEVGHGGNTRGFTADMFFLPEHRVGMVVLTNLRLANQFLGSVGQKLLDILFGAESKAEAMVTAEKKALDDGTELIRRRIKTDVAPRHGLAITPDATPRRLWDLLLSCKSGKNFRLSLSPGPADSAWSNPGIVGKLFSQLHHGQRNSN